MDVLPDQERGKTSFLSPAQKARMQSLSIGFAGIMMVALLQLCTAAEIDACCRFALCCFALCTPCLCLSFLMLGSRLFESYPATPRDARYLFIPMVGTLTGFAALFFHFGWLPGLFFTSSAAYALEVYTQGVTRSPFWKIVLWLLGLSPANGSGLEAFRAGRGEGNPDKML